jgi:hypothetical protein
VTAENEVYTATPFCPCVHANSIISVPSNQC